MMLPSYHRFDGTSMNQPPEIRTFLYQFFMFHLDRSCEFTNR